MISLCIEKKVTHLKCGDIEITISPAAFTLNRPLRNASTTARTPDDILFYSAQS